MLICKKKTRNRKIQFWIHLNKRIVCKRETSCKMCARAGARPGSESWGCCWIPGPAASSDSSPVVSQPWCREDFPRFRRASLARSLGACVSNGVKKFVAFSDRRYFSDLFPFSELFRWLLREILLYFGRQNIKTNNTCIQNYCFIISSSASVPTSNSNGWLLDWGKCFCVPFDIDN